MRCGTPLSLPLRTELEKAYRELESSSKEFAYSICKTLDGKAWEVITKEENIYSSLESSYKDSIDAIAAGSDWLRNKTVPPDVFGKSQ